MYLFTPSATLALIFFYVPPNFIYLFFDAPPTLACSCTPQLGDNTLRLLKVETIINTST